MNEKRKEEKHRTVDRMMIIAILSSSSHSSIKVKNRDRESIENEE
jgi:hypothetical protein